MGVKEAHDLFQDSMKLKVEFEDHGNKLTSAMQALFPCLEKALSVLAQAQAATLGSPQRSALLREFGEAAASCAKHSDNIRSESGYIADLLVQLAQQHADTQKALLSAPLN